MRLKHRYIAALAAAALLLSACGKGSSGASGASSGSTAASSGREGAWRSGLYVATQAAEENGAGEIRMIAAAVLLDGEGRIVHVALDELESRVSAAKDGSVTMPEDLRTKRQKGEEDYPLAAASPIKKGWAEQADAFGEYLRGMTGEEVAKLKTDADGYAKDADLVSGCTIKVEGYRDAVAAACERAEALGAAEGDSLALGVQAVDGTSGALQATDDKDVTARLELSVAAVTADAQGHVTSALCDEAEPALTIAADGGIKAPDRVDSKREQGDGYGMKKASALGKEWYEHSEGFCDYLKGKTASQIAGLDGEESDLRSLCTIDISELRKAVLAALDGLSA